MVPGGVGGPTWRVGWLVAIIDSRSNLGRRLVLVTALSVAIAGPAASGAMSAAAQSADTDDVVDEAIVTPDWEVTEAADDQATSEVGETAAKTASGAPVEPAAPESSPSVSESPAPSPARDLGWIVLADGEPTTGTEWVLEAEDGTEWVLVDNGTDDLEPDQVADADPDDGSLVVEDLPVGEWELSVAVVAEGLVALDEPIEVTVEEGDDVQELDDVVLDQVPVDEASPGATEKPADEPAEDTTEEPAEDATEEPSEEATEEATTGPVEEVTDEPTPAPTGPEAAAADEPVDQAPPAVEALVVPEPGPGEAVITVSVGGDRTGTNAVGPVGGVVLRLYNSPTTANPVTQPWGTCTSDADGDCSFVVPNTQPPGQGGVNRDDRFYIRQQSAPAGWRVNDALDTGPISGTTISTPYVFRTGPQLRAGNVYESTDDFMIGTGSTNRVASSGIWQNSRNNPSLDAACGLDVAIVHDLSGSVGPSLGALKNASTSFVDALTGTPSRIAALTFSDVSPRAGASNANLQLTSVSTAASAQTVTNRINGYTTGGGTNWDRGLYQAATTGPYDVVLMITDGNPTLYSDPAQGPGDYTRFREVENGIFSANALKATGARVIAVGVGDGVSGGGENLAAISGPVRYDGSNGATADYLQTDDFQAAGDALRRLALGACEGSISVVKSVVPPGGTLAEASPTGGWQFTAATTAPGVTVSAPATRVTAAATGAVNFPLQFVGTTSGPVTITETTQPGYTLRQVQGQNAVCTRTDDGTAVAVTNSGTAGFTVTGNATAPISCQVYNEAPRPQASVVVDKQWVVNGTTYEEGSQPDGIDAQLSLTGPEGAVATSQQWGITRTGYAAGDTAVIDEQVELDQFLCTLDDQELTAENGATLAGNVATLNQGLNRFQYTNTVTCDTWLTLEKEVANGSASDTDWTLTAFAPDGALPGPTGVEGSPGATQVSITPGVTYQLAESGGPPEYLQEDQRSDLQNNPLSTGSMQCVELDESGEVVPGFADGLNGGVIANLGMHVRCTATNYTATLELVKLVEDPTGTVTAADFDLTATPVGSDIPDGLGPTTVTGSEQGVEVEVRPDQAYQVSESGVPGFDLDSLTCRTGGGPPLETDTITLGGFEGGLCTFTNTRQSTTLTLDKTWNDPVAGDSVDLTVSGAAGTGEGTVAGDGTVDDPATLTVYAGEVVDLTETFAPGDPDQYSTALTCDSGDLSYTSGGRAGSVEITEVPDAGISCQFANTRRTAQLTLTKDWVNGLDGDQVDLTATGDSGLAPEATGDSTVPTPTNDAVLTIHAGETITLAEQLDAANVATYDADLTCTDPDGLTYTTGDASGTYDVPAIPGDVTCSFTNTRRQSGLTLVKDWVNSIDGDTATITAAGTNSDSTDAVAPDEAGVNIDVLAGEQIVLSEVLDGGNQVAYDADLTCTDADGLTYTPGAQTGTYQVPSDPVDVVCTFTNTRRSAELTVTKEWVDAADGDVAGFEAGGGISPPVQGTSTAPDTTTDAVLTVFAGETITLEEALGALNLGSYDADLACTDADGLTYTAGELEGTYDVPADPSAVTCTFTNTRRSATLTLTKAWVDPVTGDIVDLLARGDSGLEADATGTSVAPDTTTDATLTIHSGEQVLLDETYGSTNQGSYTDELTCSEPGLSSTGRQFGYYDVSSDPVDVTCTFTNTAERGTIVIVKNVEGADDTFDFTGDWPDPADDTTPVADFQLSTTDGTASVTYSGVLVPADGSSYTVTELDPTPEYDGTSLTCEELDGDDGSSADGLTGTIDLDAGETVTCTYTNTQRSTITVVKDAVPDDDQVFSYTTSGDPLADAFDLVDDGTDTANTFTSGLVPADGTYSVAETPVDGWTLATASCDNGNDVGQIEPEPGTNVTCTFVNLAEPGAVTVTKSVTGVAAGLDWTFDIAIDPVDANVISPQAVSGTGEGSDTVTFEPLTLNQTYTIAEPDLPAGWEQTSFTCTVADEDPQAPGHQVTITEPGQTIDCAITNMATPSGATVVKQVTGIDDTLDWAFDFTISPTTDGEFPTQTATGTGPGVGEVEWLELVPGETYTISETPVAGYLAGELACQGVSDLDQDPQSVTFVAPVNTGVGYEVTCQILNTAIPSDVEVTKTSRVWPTTSTGSSSSPSPRCRTARPRRRWPPGPVTARPSWSSAGWCPAGSTPSPRPRRTASPSPRSSTAPSSPTSTTIPRR